MTKDYDTYTFGTSAASHANNGRRQSGQTVNTRSGNFASTIKQQYGIILGAKVVQNSLFSAYEAQVASERGGGPKLLKVYTIDKWPQEHQERVRSMYTEGKIEEVKGAPRVHQVIEDENALLVLTDAHDVSLIDHAARHQQTGSQGNAKKIENQLATWYTQILRAMSRASDSGIYFERMTPEHTLFLNDKNQVIIGDFAGCTYMSNKSDSGFVRCKRNILDPMISPPEIDRLASGDVVLEEDSLVSGEIWLAGAIIYNILSNGQKYPEYEAKSDGRRKLIIPDSMGPPFSNDMRRFLKAVLEYEPEYRPRDHGSAVEHDWIIAHRQEVMVPSMQSLRDEYKSVVSASRRGGPTKKVSQMELNTAKNNFNAMAKQNRLVLGQGEKKLVDGCLECAESRNLEKQFISGYGWAPTKYEKRILDGSYNGLLPSSILNRKPIESQAIRRAAGAARNDIDFRDLTLYSDDYSKVEDKVESHMQEVLDDVTPPDFNSTTSETEYDELTESSTKDEGTGVYSGFVPHTSYTSDAQSNRAALRKKLKDARRRQF